MLPVLARPEVADDVSRLPPALLRAVRGLLLRSPEGSDASQPALDYDRRIENLGDCRKVYFDQSTTIRPAGYRSVHRLVSDEDAPTQIQIVSIGPRANLDVYRQAATRLERR